MKGSNSKQNKALNLRLVLSQIVTLGPLSRVEISRNTHLTKQTITNMVEELLEANLVIELGVKKEGCVGKPSKMLSLNKDSAYTVAFRINKTDIQAGIFSLNGEQLNTLSTTHNKTDLITQAEFLFNTLLTVSQIQKDKLLGVALSFTDSDQRSIESFKQSKLLQSQLSEVFSLPVALETTASACAAYQMLYGEARELHSFIYIHLGDVVEASVVYDRQIMLGQNGLTGAIGELFVTPETNNKTAELGRLNDFASLNSLKEFLGKQDNTNEAIIQYYAKNPDKVELWFDTAAEPMRIAIHTLESILNCETIILGGDINTQFLDKFITLLRPFIPSISQFGERHVVRLIKTPDVENISLKGVATLPLHAALNNENMQTITLPLQDNFNEIQRLIYT